MINKQEKTERGLLLLALVVLAFGFLFLGEGITGAVTFTLPAGNQMAENFTVEPIVVNETLPEEQLIVRPPVEEEQPTVEEPIEETAPEEPMEEILPEEKLIEKVLPEETTEELSTNESGTFGISGIVGIMAAPVVGNVTLNSSSNTNTSAENLTLYWDITDADGDDVKNITNWKLNGTSITVLNMPFENSSGNMSGDYSGFENNGTTNTATWNATGGYDGKGAFEFDGKDDRIKILGTTGINNETGTAAFWVKPTNTAPINEYMLQVSRDPNRMYMIRAVTTNNFYVTMGNPSTDISSTSSIDANKWSHITLTWEDETAKLYFDGSLVKTGIYSNVSGITTPISIGSYGTDGSTTSSHCNV